MKIRKGNNGFSLLEVVVGMTILVLVATTAIASLRSGVATLTATENNALAIDAIREFSEYSYGFTVLELDNLNGTTMAPVLANGDTLPGAGDMMLSIDVQPVEDLDPSTTVATGAESSTRVVTVIATADGQTLLEAAWLVTEH